MKYTIDRFEYKYAICENKENGELTNIPIEDMPKNAKEGDTIIFANRNIYHRP
ncbi:MAG: DUF3006 domain-containing protein [Oscillospiraceae bacterium]|nr:DUF3006 domain-containing protein [Oscillospiraceae bacterium]